MIDLHLHLDGSLSPQTVLNLAKMENVVLPTNDSDELKKFLSVPKNCKSLNDYLKCFEMPLSVLQTKKAIQTAVFDLKEELKKQGLIYVEIRFAPQLHMQKGLSQSEIVKAAIEGAEKSSLKSNLILCCMRGNNNHAENIETVKVAKEYLNKGVCAIDLAGAEALFKTETFWAEFELANKLNVPFVIHAGEADGADSVKSALNFGAKRIGHGIRAIEDKNLLKRIVENKIPLEMCTTSNFQTKVAKSKKEYPFREFLDAGVKVTINTDNTTVSNTNIKNEFVFLRENYNLSKQEELQILNNAVDVAFVSDKEKQKLRELIAQKFDIWRE